MAADYRYRDSEFLRQQYVEANRSTQDIAAECDVSTSTVSRWLARHDIEREPPYQDEDWLFKQYITRGRSVSGIAEHCAVEVSTISYWIGRHGISKTDSFDRTSCATCGESFRYYPSVREGTYCSNECAHEPTKRQVTVCCPNCGVEFERRASLDTHYCSPACWGEDLYVGSDGLYSGGWQRQRTRALERDGYECTVCGVSEEEYKEQAGRSLDVHHKVPVRLFAQWGKPVSDAHALRNLVTVCRRHHPDSPGG